ncbi:MAG: bifunctional phosphopantothenoylcysteine decarboxylase/phosphopantothenate--cysteine ligase CoaBC [Candidatus Aceula meridiana]|nr:bifunctional phosphopantothenoylcysteine decarboxylase/phosphopantothenate--cysteine ligase CoaBC [Candidatus Aceula meridiana]
MVKKDNTKQVVLAVTASIAAYKACEIIRSLQKKQVDVTVVMTASAEKFISSLTLASLSGTRAYKDMFEDSGSWEMEHISLAQKADLFLVAPATANMIGKMAHGLADDLVSCVALTTKAPIVIAPAMNTAMYQNKIVQENIAKLKSKGAKFIDPVKGKLACGTTGEGHLAEVETIVKKVCALLKNR